MRYCRCQFVLRIWRQPIARPFCRSLGLYIFRSVSRKQVIFAIASGRVFSRAGWRYQISGRPCRCSCGRSLLALSPALATAGVLVGRRGVYRGLRFDLALCRDRRANRVAGFGVDGESPFGHCRGQGGYSILALLFAIWLALRNRFVGFVGLATFRTGYGRNGS